jgi:hypothetical protein
VIAWNESLIIEWVLVHGRSGKVIKLTESMEKGSTEVQAFTAIGRVEDDRVYEHATFVPFRRNIM